MVSTQKFGGDREIIEAVGPLAIHLCCEVVNGSLWLRSHHTTLLGLKLPALFAIQVVARERPIDARSYRCDVRLRSPLFGCLLQYCGTLHLDQQP